MRNGGGLILQSSWLDGIAKMILATGGFRQPAAGTGGKFPRHPITAAAKWRKDHDC